MAIAEKELIHKRPSTSHPDPDIWTKYRESEAQPFLYTKEQYYRMGKLGWFNDHKVELIEGQIFELSPIGLPHWQVVNRVNRLIAKVLPDGFFVSIQNSLDTSKRSEPVPDAAVIRGSEFDLKSLPQTAVLAIEVSHTTLTHDRRKADNYARAGIPEYWIINLKNRTVEVYREPSGEREAPGTGVYAGQRIYSIGEVLAPSFSSAIQLPVSELMPPES